MNSDEKYVNKNYKWEVAACYLWGIPFAAVGVLLCATIVFAPVGLLAFTVAGWPLAYQQKRHLERKQEWLDRDRPMPNDSVKPWLVDLEVTKGSVSDFALDVIEPDA